MGDSVLVLNTGSSSIKAALLAVAATGTTEVLWRGQRPWSPADAHDLGAQVGEVLEPWLRHELEPWRGSVSLVAHRVVHGGADLQGATRLDGPVRQAIAAAQSLAPLHNRAALAVIDWMEAWLAQWQPGLAQWACFDTAFHHTLAPAQFTYAIPEAWRQQGLRRYGFHGLNHEHIAETVAAIRFEEGCSADELAQLRIISAHLGAGCSLCAIKGGRSVATSMGMTPLEGLVMATRSGSLDPGLLLHLLQHGVGAGELNQALNHRSGLLALSGLSGDMTQLRRAAAAGHGGAQLAIEVFTARLLEGIGAMAAVLGGVDVIALSGGIGQNDEVLAHALHQQLQWLGRFRLLQIPADEEGQIARQCAAAAGLI